MYEKHAIASPQGNVNEIHSEYHLTPVRWILLKRQKVTNAGEYIEV